MDEALADSNASVMEAMDGECILLGRDKWEASSLVLINYYEGIWSGAIARPA